MAKKEIIHAQGKRKQAIARATLKPGNGKVTVNGLYLHNYGTELLRMRIAEPLTLAGEDAQKVNFEVHVSGGGVNGQADAIRLAMARALVQYDVKLKKTFDEYDRLLLVADVRRKETRKPNDSRARAARQKSYR
ncbi:30S ribosomal protein S9 [Candidatus Woesearchaeota archaeon]|nr:30S ribosomal protein S9 [Candidatus Woesearchaeota archaeon]MBI2582252.1 30S ribosomal protein S9 [Candidatus Woesearchaeota archaeon]